MIRVLVVDDSAVVRRVLTEALNAQEGIEVIDTAPDPYVAREKIVKLQPDVITLDIEMPRMDGLTFLNALMKHYPIPVVIVSSLTPKNSSLALRALAAGAVEVLCKPTARLSTPEMAAELTRAIYSAAGANVKKLVARQNTAPEPGSRIDYELTNKLLAIGASTGGPRAVENIVQSLPANGPGTLIVQHMPANFTQEFANRLDSLTAMTVREARDGDVLTPGLALVAPGDRHMTLSRSGAAFVARIQDGQRVNFHRPSVDVLFNSVARTMGPNAVGVLLTGMGNDGAAGLLAMRQAGAHTIAEHEDTCIVYGMPKEAVRMGAAVEVLPLDKIPGAAVRGFRRRAA
jgi:two-component system, chemotaxis family, protein-glutamate methylesterase/glutaminase